MYFPNSVESDLFGGRACANYKLGREMGVIAVLFGEQALCRSIEKWE